MQDLNIDEDGISDEYDFMDDVANGSSKRPTGRGDKGLDPKKKYMAILQDVADRYTSEVTIELDDLDTVCPQCITVQWHCHPCMDDIKSYADGPVSTLV